jgi:hypothetical protein
VPAQRQRTNQEGTATMSVTPTSPAFLGDEIIAREFTCDGKDIAPPPGSALTKRRARHIHSQQCRSIGVRRPMPAARRRATSLRIEHPRCRHTVPGAQGGTPERSPNGARDAHDFDRPSHWTLRAVMRLNVQCVGSSDAQLFHLGMQRRRFDPEQQGRAARATDATFGTA